MYNFGCSVSYGCECVSDSRVLRRKLEPKREEVTEDWRKLHNELNELHDFLSSPNMVLGCSIKKD